MISPSQTHVGLEPVPTMRAELYHRSECQLAEGPVWDAGALHWVDIAGKCLHVKADGARDAQRYELDVEPGALVRRTDGCFVLATARGFELYDPRMRRLEPWTNPEARRTANRFNDGKCDLRGRFVAGTLNRNRQPEAALYVLDHDRRVRELLRPLTCSNGLAWSADGTEFYHIDTPTKVVRAFAYDLDRATLGEARTVIRIPDGHGLPDGMTIDRDGNLWLALWDGWAVECWDPRSGRRLARIEVPAARVTSCVFGGEDYRTLFITTARQGLEVDALARQELAGSIFCVQPGVAGFPAVPFRDDGGGVS